MKWQTVETMFCKVAFVIIFIGCMYVLLDFKLNPPVKIVEIEKIVDSGWHLPDRTDKNLVAQIKYIKI